MTDRARMSSPAAATGQNVFSTDAQQTNGHVQFSFRKRFEKIDWRKIGLFVF